MLMRKSDRRLTELDASALATELAEGRAKAEAVTRAYLDRIADEDGALGAFAHIDPDYALRQAMALDRHRSTGRAIGTLHGMPVAIEDIIDVRGLPCENGTPIDAGRMPRKDAFLVSRLREAGAVILGKTVTTELAVLHAGKTANPADPEQASGGSSSGSAAAVAACLAPLAVGTHTDGSVICPASYCGIVGYKPSYGMISRRGVLTVSPTLDTVGVFARTVEDAALLGDALAGFDAEDRAMQPGAPPRLAATAATKPPLRPNLAFVRSPVWDESDEDVREGFEELVGSLGDAVDAVELPEPFARGHDLHRTIMLVEMARHLSRYHEKGLNRLSRPLAGMIDEGRKVLAMDYALAVDWIELMNSALDRLFERFDAIITPATTGEAPRELETAGSPAFCTLWSYCGVPAVTLPLLVGSNGRPIGVQLVGARGNDARLLRTARWLVETLRADVAGGRTATALA